MHGVFAPHPLAVAELANLPNWTALEMRVDGEHFSLDRGEILAYRRVLDMSTGVLRRDVTWRSPRGATVRVTFERFASLSHENVAALRATVTAVDGSPTIEIRSPLTADGSSGGRMHLAWADGRVSGDIASILASVVGTPTSVAVATRLAVRGPGTDTRTAQEPIVGAGVTSVARWKAVANEPATVEKIAVLSTSRQASDPHGAAVDDLAALSGEDFDSLLVASARAWAADWAVSDVVIDGDDEAQGATRFSLYHLLIAAPRSDDDVSIGARTLSGFGYHGHVFWDTETFMLPFFSHLHPAIARNLLSYRYHRLAGARHKAAANGFDGAQFPWESADTGEEVTPSWVPNPADPNRPIRIWTGDIEIHISAAVAKAVADYWSASGDDRFVLERGAEIVIETARFWASRAEWKPEAGRFEFTDVIGPDEYHDHVDNNAFTNHLAAWHLLTAADVAEWLLTSHRADAERLGVEDGLPARLRDVAAHIYLPRDAATGLIPQFDGYFSLEDVDLRRYEGRTRSMQAILGIEGVGRTQVIKQPDVVMLAYLLPGALTDAEMRANHAYYTPRTDHEYGSSLGPAVQAIMSVRVGDLDGALGHFRRAAAADLHDVRGNAADGIHAASAGGLWQAIVFGFGGVRFDGERVLADPRLPVHWSRLAFQLVRRGRRFVVEATRRAGRDPAAPPVRGLIFDLDGVITDTAELHYQAWQRLADEERLPFDRRANEALRGISRRESLRRVLGGRRVSERDEIELMDRKNGYYRSLLRSLTPDDVLPGAVELVKAARSRGLCVALASASKNAREVLERLDLVDCFDVVCDGYSVEAPKPAPDLFLAAAAAMELTANECVVVEDAADGVAAAHRAGMAAVGIGPVDRVGAADLVAATTAGLDLDAMLRAGTRIDVRVDPAS